MVKGKLYGIGIGPGDPELLTLKAVKVLNKIDVVAFPKSREDGESIAFKIAGVYLKNDVEILPLLFPMKKDEKEKQRIREKNAMLIKEIIDSGRDVAYLTLGDSLLYSTYIYIIEILKKYDIEIETIPGIPSFCAISSRLNIPLAKQDQNLVIISVNKTTDIERAIADMDNVVFMKVSTDNVRLADTLQKYKGNDIIITSKCGTPEEYITNDLDELYNDPPYLTTLIFKKK